MTRQRRKARKRKIQGEVEEVLVQAEDVGVRVVVELVAEAMVEAEVTVEAEVEGVEVLADFRRCCTNIYT